MALYVLLEFGKETSISGNRSSSFYSFLFIIYTSAAFLAHICASLAILPQPEQLATHANKSGFKSLFCSCIVGHVEAWSLVSVNCWVAVDSRSDEQALSPRLITHVLIRLYRGMVRQRQLFRSWKPRSSAKHSSFHWFDWTGCVKGLLVSGFAVCTQLR